MNILKFVKRWIDSKKMTEEDWYTKYYDEFYVQKYLIFQRRLEKYKQTRGCGEVKPFYEWFLDEYIKNEIYPNVF